jgi:SAM-dependent methyltransferase
MARATAERWQEFFSHPAYVRFASQILDGDRTAREVETATRLLALEPGARVLDLGCGYGRVSLPLARMGFAVTGLDASAPMLELARERAGEEGAVVDFVHGDMRELDAVEAFDAVLSLGTAIGYVESGDGDALAAAARALVPGGRLLVDTENREPKLRMAPRVWFDMSGTTIRCERRYDHLSGRWHERMSWDGDGAAYSLRLYTAVELREMLEAAGLSVHGLWGGLDESGFTADSARMVIRAVKG